jgi:DNA-binding response OmpR family regulator
MRWCIVTTQTFAGSRIKAGPLVIDTDARTTKVNGKLTRQVTKREYAVLMVLARQPDACVDRERIIRQVWGEHALTVPGARTLDSTACSLRRKLRAVAPTSGLVQNVHGVGYRLLPANPEED